MTRVEAEKATYRPMVHSTQVPSFKYVPGSHTIVGSTVGNSEGADVGSGVGCGEGAAVVGRLVAVGSAVGCGVGSNGMGCLRCGGLECGVLGRWVERCQTELLGVGPF